MEDPPNADLTIYLAVAPAVALGSAGGDCDHLGL